MTGVTFNRDEKFDLQLSQALIDERRLADVFQLDAIERSELRVELKSESYLWERTGNICVEFRRNGKPSGISSTQADWWVHELKALDGSTVVYLVFPIERLKELARAAIRRGDWRSNAGDGGLSDVALIRIRDLMRLWNGSGQNARAGDYRERQ